jgi:hypothetical protein
MKSMINVVRDRLIGKWLFERLVIKKTRTLIFFLLVLCSLVSINEKASAQNIDIRLLREINLHRNTSLDGTFKFLSNSAAPITFATPVILYSVGLINSDSVLKRKALIVGASVITAAVITTIMKKVVIRFARNDCCFL